MVQSLAALQVWAVVDRSISLKLARCKVVELRSLLCYQVVWVDGRLSCPVVSKLTGTHT